MPFTAVHHRPCHFTGGFQFCSSVMRVEALSRTVLIRKRRVHAFYLKDEKVGEIVTYDLKHFGRVNWLRIVEP